MGAGQPSAAPFRPETAARLTRPDMDRPGATATGRPRSRLLPVRCEVRVSKAMAQPSGFSWIEKPLLAAMARPESAEELAWLRKQGIELLIALTEDPPRRDWVDDAGLLLFHVPMEDMEAPTQDQLDRCWSAITKANERQM